MILSFTGHRPDKLGGYNIPNPIYNCVVQETKKLIQYLNPDKCITGMALGFDQYVAQICCELNIPFIAAVPFVGQESVWNEQAKITFKKLLSKAKDIVIVCEGSYASYKLQKRNEWMVDNSDCLIACWDGTLGGTFNCIKYASSKNKQMYRINPKDINNPTDI